MKWIKLFENFNIKYYRAVMSFIGNKFEFIPQDCYEGINDNNEPEYIFGEFHISEIPEVCGSKYIGGAVLGSISMDKKFNVIHIYEICQTPDKDISQWTSQDFKYLQEVRWRNPVKGIYIGSVSLTNEEFN